MSPFASGLRGVNQPLNELFTKSLWFSLVVLCAIILLARFTQMFHNHIRHLFSLTAGPEQQRYWTQDKSSWWPWVKRNLLYAPLNKKRHNREMRLSSAINMGTLPSRFHALLLFAYVASNVAYCTVLNYRDQTRAECLAELRGRSGALAVVNMIPLFVLAGRNNPLIGMLRVSFDTYNLLHRWMGRMVVLEALVHTIAWAANVGVSNISETVANRRSFQFAAVGSFGLLFMLIQSPSAIRHAFYETFLHLHQAAALAVLIGVYFHLDLDRLPQLPYVKVIIAIWLADRTIRFLRVYYRCYSWRDGWTTVRVEALPGEACRVTFDLRRGWMAKPGIHAYVYLPSVSFTQSHPFSIAWSETASTAASAAEKTSALPTTNVNAVANHLPRRATSVSMVIHKRTGMTASLYDRAAASPNGVFTTRGALEGPYGGLESLHSYGTIMLFAGGIGITHQLSHIYDLVRLYPSNTIATRRVVLVWTVRTTEHLEWVRPWMDTLLALPGRRAMLKILLFVTKPRSPREIVSPSATVCMFPGRPNAEVLIEKEMEERCGGMAVTVCGPGSLADSVRAAVRERTYKGSVDFIEESFTW